MTRSSYKVMEEKLKTLRHKDLPEISKEKLEAASQGDLSENAGYEYAKQKLEMIQNKIREMTSALESVQFIEDLPIKGDIVSIGTVVTVSDMDKGSEITYTILGPADSDYEKNILSFKSPIA
ncbi:GreA/GreB family elongation factor, partial [Candidatus Auribacterota bacterium]